MLLHGWIYKCPSCVRICRRRSNQPIRVQYSSLVTFQEKEEDEATYPALALLDARHIRTHELPLQSSQPLGDQVRHLVILYNVCLVIKSNVYLIITLIKSNA